MRIMMASEQDDERRQKSGRPDMAAQYHELAIRFRNLEAYHQFKPGEFVRFKHGWGFRSVREIGDCAWIFIRYLDPDRNWVDRQLVREEISGSGSNINALGVDCVIVTQGVDAASTQPLIIASSTIEPDDAAPPRVVGVAA